MTHLLLKKIKGACCSHLNTINFNQILITENGELQICKPGIAGLILGQRIFLHDKRTPTLSL